MGGRASIYVVIWGTSGKYLVLAAVGGYFRIWSFMTWRGRAMGTSIEGSPFYCVDLSERYYMTGRRETRRVPGKAI
jgi:hypothetical protein